MKKLQALALMMAISVPVMVQAADVPVEKNSALGAKISSTASPAVNKAIRKVSDEDMRSAKALIAPQARAFMDRLQVTVSPGTLKGEHMDITYPIVGSASKDVERKINKVISNYIKELQKDVMEDNKESKHGATNLYVNYDVKADGNGIFSVLIKSYTIKDYAANGKTEVKGFTFNTTTGKKLSLSDFGGLSESKILEGFMAAPQEWRDNTFGEADLNDVDSFYAEEDHDIVLIYDQGEIGPRSAGTLFLPVGNLGR